MTSTYTKAQREDANLRLALVGGPGSGKTYTALALASEMADGDKIAVIDTEAQATSEYAPPAGREPVPPPEDGFPTEFAFNSFNMGPPYEPSQYIKLIKAAEKEGQEVLIIDSISPAWIGEGGVLEIKDEADRTSNNPLKISGWAKATPEHNRFVAAMIGCNMHLIVTIQTKTEWVIEDVGGKKVPKAIGTGMYQRDTLAYYFGVVGVIDETQTMHVTKSRVPGLNRKMIQYPGADLAQRFLDHYGGVIPIQQVLPPQIEAINDLVKNLKSIYPDFTDASLTGTLERDFNVTDLDGLAEHEAEQVKERLLAKIKELDEQI